MLLNHGALTDDSKDMPGRETRLKPILARVDHVCLLDHRVYGGRNHRLLAGLYDLNKFELDLLFSLNRNLDTRFPSYKEVFIKSGSTTQVYGVVATAEEWAVIESSPEKLTL